MHSKNQLPRCPVVIVITGGYKSQPSLALALDLDFIGLECDKNDLMSIILIYFVHKMQLSLIRVDCSDESLANWLNWGESASQQ